MKIERIKDLPKLSRIAWSQSGREVKRKVNKLGYELKNYIDTKDCLTGWLVENELGQILVFQDTKNPFIYKMKGIKDWITNFKCSPFDSMIGQVHGGYWNLIYNNYDEVAKRITDTNLICTGFSQGGGIAELTAGLLNTEMGLNATFFNIDGPAIRTDKGYNNGYYLVNSTSIVPRLPLEAMGFKHMGDLLYFTWRGKFFYNPKRIVRRLDYIAGTAQNIKEITERRFAYEYFEHNIIEIEEFWNKNINKIERVI